MRKNMNSDYQRVVVIGVTGSGKTTFAKALADALDCAKIELDALQFGPNWTEPPLAVFRDRVAGALTGDKWVVDGNYSKVRDIVWTKADTVIWLNYPLPVVLWRLFRRTIKRLITHEALWEYQNRESWRAQFLSRDSLFLWALKSYRKHHRTYPNAFQQPEYAHLRVIRLRSPQSADQWLAKFVAPLEPKSPP
jgi:adenylate kinase family enzyme